ncbi:DUF4224 domain-containing protein [Variovorax boronicumulans]|uniref:DUF4224 domain-containing protein n=1 Tax=Variovorax boronicumulans TaxID=436515 RepID=UPI000785D658|nr:DUF4224 domain-containing protein [Variovorax boronicumulans]
MTLVMFLTDQELERLTGYKIKSRQIAWLRSQGIPFRVSGTGHPVVTRVAIEGPSISLPAASPAPIPWVPAVLQRERALPPAPVSVAPRRALAVNPSTCVPPTCEKLASLEPPHQHPAGALLRVKDICGDRKNGQPGLLPIVSRTWLKWVEQGRVPQGILLGTHTRVWPVEQVLAVREGLPVGGAAPDEQHIKR